LHYYLVRNRRDYAGGDPCGEREAGEDNTTFVQAADHDVNIFVLSFNPTRAAEMLCDAHVNKMLLESAQLLNNVFPEGTTTYRHTHYNHPCSVWVRDSRGNFEWLLHHARAIASEFKFRFGHKHKAEDVINYLGRLRPRFPHRPSWFAAKTTHVQAMPDMYKARNAVTAYRDYYIGEKRKIAVWKHGRKPPYWWPWR
jgi:hypothetical protein